MHEVTLDSTAGTRQGGLAWQVAAKGLPHAHVSGTPQVCAWIWSQQTSRWLAQTEAGAA